MEIVIRKPNLEPRINGVPKDFAETKDYFNKALEKNQLSWIPRKTPITDKEIIDLWIPSLKTNITRVAEVDGKVVGQVTVFYDTKTTSYEHANQREPGNIGFTVKPDFYEKVTLELIKGLVKELKEQDKKAVWTTAIESPGNKLMQELGYKPNILENQDRYKQAGLSGKVCEYKLP
jgi:hypothetical protein